jgi:hypothetical protein
MMETGYYEVISEKGDDKFGETNVAMDEDPLYVSSS